MASSASAVIDLGDDDLQFTETTPPGGVGGGDGVTHTFGHQVPDSAVDNEDEDESDRANLLGGSGGSGSKFNFWSVEFYQRFFDVDTDEVGARIKGALLPLPGRSFLSDAAKNKPDLYGPFWICATLVVSVAVTGNLASYLQAAWLNGGKDFVWHYDFHKVTLAAAAVFSYAWLVPAGVYGFLWWTASSCTVGLLDLLCLYGYSLAVYVPVSVLWLIQNSLVQWALVLVAAGLSGAVIVMALYPAFKEGSVKSSSALLLVIVALHLLLACGFMLYFFHVPPALANNDNQSEQTDNNKNSTLAVPETNPEDSDKKVDDDKDADDKKENVEKRTVDDQGGGGDKEEVPVQQEEQEKVDEDENKIDSDSENNKDAQEKVADKAAELPKPAEEEQPV